MINPFHKTVDLFHDIIDADSKSYESKLLFGTVITVDPLLIRLEDGVELPSKHFYLLDSVIVKKAKVLVHRMCGQPQEVHFQGTANEIANAFNMLMYNSQGNTTSFNLNFAAPQGASGGSTSIPSSYGIAGPNFNRHLTMQNGEYTFSAPNLSGSKVMQGMGGIWTAKQDIYFNLEFVEQSGNEFKQDESQQNQTIAIECILWCGLRPQDIVLLASFNHNQKYLVCRILNRLLDQFEHGIGWDSRLNDVLGTEQIPRH